MINELFIGMHPFYNSLDFDCNLLDRLTTVWKSPAKLLFKTVEELNDFWHIGAQLTEGLGVSLVIGNPNTNVKTASIALI